MILYSKIYETFRAISNNNNKLKDNDKVRLNDFIEVLAMLARSYDDALEKDIMYKLVKIINS